MNTIITIARQFGSGGREIGHRIAEILGVKCYDRDLITLAAEKSGLSEEALHHADEKAASSLLYTLVMSSNMYHSNIDRFNIPINDKLFCVQSEIIREIAQKESCVIVGRCADYILAEHPRVVRVYLYSDFENRVKKICAEESITEADARDKVVKTDKRRANYYNYYSGQKWGKIDNYDLALSTDKLGMEGTARFIVEYARAVYPD